MSTEEEVFNVYFYVCVFVLSACAKLRPNLIFHFYLFPVLLDGIGKKVLNQALQSAINVIGCYMRYKDFAQ